MNSTRAVLASTQAVSPELTCGTGCPFVEPVEAERLISVRRNEVNTRAAGRSASRSVWFAHGNLPARDLRRRRPRHRGHAPHPGRERERDAALAPARARVAELRRLRREL